jgi:hypothetical protein
MHILSEVINISAIILSLVLFSHSADLLKNFLKKKGNDKLVQQYKLHYVLAFGIVLLFTWMLNRVVFFELAQRDITKSSYGTYIPSVISFICVTGLLLKNAIFWLKNNFASTR